MKPFAYTARCAALSLALLAGACSDDTDGTITNPPGTPTDSVQGTFRVSLTGPNAINSTGFSAMSGTVYDGPQPPSQFYADGQKSGDCILRVTELPNCSPKCSGGAICVATNKCQEQPTALNVGKVTVTGLKDRDGATSFVSTPVSAITNNYQVPSGKILLFPPCDEGATVSLAAEGSASAGAFNATAKGIAPLVVKEGDITLEGGKPLVLQWTAPTKPGNKLQVEVNITNHGGHKGKISCETADDGSLEIAASLVDGLKALGVSGFPTVELTRSATGSSAQAQVDLVIEQKIVKELTIPGVISCFGDIEGECPMGQTCADEKVCK